jgi:glycosyltransferase involved in cell wall biosynthesis
LKIALIAAPFIAVPPLDYGGTELFVAHLAEGLANTGIDVIVYANGDSTVNVEKRWIYPHSQWPIEVSQETLLKDLHHHSWAIADAAAQNCDLLHVQTPESLPFSRYIQSPMVLTLHGPHEKHLSDHYAHFPDVQYVCISHAQCESESLPKVRTIHHGIDVQSYRFVERKQQWLSFLGRIAPSKGTELAIEVAERTGIPLKVAGEVQPVNQEYFDSEIKPRIDGKLVEFIGPVDHEAKNELLGNSMAMLFPIQWDEPFGLVMVEAMACGTPVLAMPGGSVPEVVRNGVSGYVCNSIEEMAGHAMNLQLDPAEVRNYVEQNFSIGKMVREYVNLYKHVLEDRRRKNAA